MRRVACALVIVAAGASPASARIHHWHPPCDPELQRCNVNSSHYGPRTYQLDGEIYGGLLQPMGDVTTAFVGEGRLSWRDSGVTATEKVYLPLQSKMATRDTIWLASLVHRHAANLDTNVWIEAGAAGIHGDHGVQGAVRLEHRLSRRYSLAVSAELRGYALGASHAVEARMSLQLGVVCVSYSVVAIDGADTETLSQPELGAVARF